MNLDNQSSGRVTAVASRLSKPRLAPYLAAAKGNERDALRLYGWNVDLSGAVYEALHVVEVVLRNAIDEQLCVWNAAQPAEARSGAFHSREWLLDPSHLLVRLMGHDLVKARSSAERAVRPQRRAPRHEDVLAQLTFGKWRFLLPGTGKKTDPGRRLLWDQAVRHGFPHLAVTSTNQLIGHVENLHRLRNRVAHLEPLLRGRSVRDDWSSMHEVLGAIDPLVQGWLTSRQRITAVLRARPI